MDCAKTDQGIHLSALPAWHRVCGCWEFCSTSWHAETLNTAVGCRGEYLQDAQADAARALHGVPQRIEGGEVNALVDAKGIVQLGAGQPCTTGERS